MKESGKPSDSGRAEILREKERCRIDEAIYEDARLRGTESVDPEEIKRDIDEKIVKVLRSLML